MKTLPLLIGLTLLLAGCETYGPIQQSVVALNSPFNADELAPYRAKGTAVITGQAFLKTQGGDVKVGAGDEVALLPGTPFLREAVAYFAEAKTVTNYDQHRATLETVIRRTIADAQGNFEFRDLPAGRYVLQVRIAWKVPGYAGGLVETGGLVYKDVTVKEGEAARVMLTK